MGAVPGTYVSVERVSGNLAATGGKIQLGEGSSGEGVGSRPCPRETSAAGEVRRRD